jgi:hypothetical protein
MPRLSADQWAQARKEWEADASATFASVAERLDVARPVVSRRASAEGWRKVPASRLRAVNEAAHAQADANSDPRVPNMGLDSTVEMEPAAAPPRALPRTPEGTAEGPKGTPVPSDPDPDLPDPETEQLAVAKRSTVIQRHRDAAVAGWGRLQEALRTHRAARSLGQKKVAFEDLKAAKITSETIAILQKVEREAWGLDAVAEEAPIVIERSYGHANA